MNDKRKTLLHKLWLLGRGVLVFVILLGTLAAVGWFSYHRYPDVARWEGSADDPTEAVRLLETDALYVRMMDPSEDTEVIGPSYPSDRRLGEVKRSLFAWNTAYIVEHVKDREDLLYVIIDGQKVLYELYREPDAETVE